MRMSLLQNLAIISFAHCSNWNLYFKTITHYYLPETVYSSEKVVNVLFLLIKTHKPKSPRKNLASVGEGMKIRVSTNRFNCPP